MLLTIFILLFSVWILNICFSYKSAFNFSCTNEEGNLTSYCRQLSLRWGLVEWRLFANPRRRCACRWAIVLKAFSLSSMPLYNIFMPCIWHNVPLRCIKTKAPAFVLQIAKP